MLSVRPEADLQADLLQLWRKLLQNDAITPDDDFFDMGGDSLLAAELVAEIERRTGRSIPEAMLFEASTARKVAQRLAEPAAIEAKAVVEVGPARDGNPLLFFHGDWGDGGFYVKPLARVLAPLMPLVAVAPHGMDGEEVPATVEEMASDRLPALLQHRPQGPYRLGGHCVGAMVALETARLLLARGHEVELVAMIDPIWTAAGEPYPTMEGAARGPVKLLPETDTGEPIMFEIAQGLEQIDEKYARAMEQYCPAPVSAPLVIFTSMYDGRPWEAIGRSFRIFHHPGGHFDWITYRAPELAARLRTYLSAHQ